jgi:hypothetical protein
MYEMAFELTVCVVEGACEWSSKSQISTTPSARPTKNTAGRVGLHAAHSRYVLACAEDKRGPLYKK